jgi:hypothetical protein
VAQESEWFGVSEVFLNGNRNPGVRSEETNLGNLTADANLAYARSIDPSVMVSLKNGGGIRNAIGQSVIPTGSVDGIPELLPTAAVFDAQGNVVKPEGGISRNDIANALSFNNGLSLLSVTPGELKALIEHGLAAGVNQGRFPQVGGMAFSYDLSRAAGERVVSLAIEDENGLDRDVLVRGGAVVGEPNRTIRMVTLDFLAGGGDGYPFTSLSNPDRVDIIEPDAPRSGTATFAANGSEQDALAEYLAAKYTPANPFKAADTAQALDQRLQNLALRSDAVIDPEPPPVLAIAALDADQAEGQSGSTPFTFAVTRSGDGSGVSTARWAVGTTGRNAADAGDFAGNRLPSGTVRFRAGETSQTITVNVRGDLEQERDERFRVSLSQARNATVGTASATGTIRNDDLIGTAGADRIRGTARPEYLDGRAGQDVLTGGPGPDLFGFRYRESPITAPDRITDFRFGEDRIAVVDPSGKPLALPASLSRAADNRSATSLSDLAAAVFADADGQRRGNQALGANGAALVRATNRAIAGTYLLINDKSAGLNTRNDLMINISGHAGRLPGLGSIAVDTVFG